MKRVLIIAISGLLLGPTVPAAAARRGETCRTCHRGIEDAHPKASLACTTCHRGDPSAKSEDRAHAGMWANPSDLRVVDQTCGLCHTAITQAVKASIMAHRSGTQSGTLFPNGLQPTREGVRFAMTPVPVHPAPWTAGKHPPGAVDGLEPLPTFKES